MASTSTTNTDQTHPDSLANGNVGGLSEEEAKLYDRQIRLWGVETQNRMRAARLLLVGLKGVNAEVCKNLVLAGINSVTILENEKVTAQDLGAHIFLQASDIGKNRGSSSVHSITRLNPLVKISCDEGDVQSKDEDYFKQFNVICASNCPRSTLIWLDTLCRKNSIYFFATDTFGYYAYFFVDLSSYQYSETLEDTKKGTSTTQTHSATFPSFEHSISVSPLSPFTRKISLAFLALQVLYDFQTRNGCLPSSSDEDVLALQMTTEELIKKHNLRSSQVPQDFTRQLAMNAKSEISPVCAILGGILAQEIIKIISGKEEPINNFFFFNGIDLRSPGEVIKA